MKRAVKAKTVAKVASTTKSKRPSPKEWAEAEAIWSAGMMTLPTLATKVGVSERAVQLHMSKAGIIRNSKVEEHKEAVAKELEKVQIDDATILALRIRETKEEHFKMVHGLGKLTWQEVLYAKTNGLPVSSAMANLKALETAIGNVGKIRIEKYALLGLDNTDFVDEDGLPSLLISELTADQIAELRQRDHTEFENIEAEILETSEDDEIVEE